MFEPASSLALGPQRILLRELYGDGLPTSAVHSNCSFTFYCSINHVGFFSTQRIRLRNQHFHYVSSKVVGLFLFTRRKQVACCWVTFHHFFRPRSSSMDQMMLWWRENKFMIIKIDYCSYCC